MSEVKLSKVEYNNMRRKIAKLDALEAGGVDNWEWYDESLKEWFKEDEIDDLADKFIANLYDTLAEAEVDEPAGRGCGHSITFDEEWVKELFIRFCDEYKKILEE